MSSTYMAAAPQITEVTAARRIYVAEIPACPRSACRTCAISVGTPVETKLLTSLGPPVCWLSERRCEQRPLLGRSGTYKHDALPTVRVCTLLAECRGGAWRHRSE